jgi:hypothetical protein
LLRRLDDSKLVIDLESSIAAERVKQQLSNLPLTIIPDEINLTRRMLEPMHRFHKLAADVSCHRSFRKEMRLSLDSEQLRVLNWRTNTSDIAALEGPRGCGKTTVGSALAVKLIAEGIAKRVLLVAYTNAAANEFGWKLFHILGPSATNICIRTGNPIGVDPFYRFHLVIQFILS